MPLPLAGALVGVVLFNIIRALVMRLVTFMVANAGRILLAFANLATIATFFQDFIAEWWDSTDTKEFVVGKFNEWIVAYCYSKTGMQLDATDPLSKASLSSALGGKLGFTLNDITSREQTMLDIGAELAQRVNQEVGTNIGNFWPLSGVREQLENEAYIAISAALAGGNSWLSTIKVDQIRSLLHQVDGVFVMRTTKFDRERMLARARQRKYASTHKRIGGTWVPK